MAALKDIKRKIGAVKKTKQITKAMNMVAASKFKSAQQRMENFRPYATKFMDVLNSLALRVDAKNHPLLAVREPKRVRVICMTADRGLCGAFNTNILKTTERFIKEKGEHRRTTFVIAQRISTVLNADKILVLDRGGIVAEGTHAELLASSTIYREIYDSQLGEGVLHNG